MSDFTFDLSSILPLAIFALFAATTWMVLDILSHRRRRAEERLDELRDPNRKNRGDKQSAIVKKSDAMSKVLQKASPTLAKPLQPKNEAETSRLRLRLANGGFRSETAVSAFLGFKFLGLLAGLLIGGSAFLGVHGVNQKSLSYVLFLAGFLFYLPDLALWLITRQRKEQIFLGLPDALDLLVVCVESGLGLDQAMRKVADEMKRSCRVIAEEFALCNLQLQMGRPRAQVLHELGSRTGVDDVRALAAILIQADKFGSSIAQALRVQSDSMRVRRRQLAEEKAAKTAVKLIFPLVIFIFPGIFVVLVGPAAITMIREMFPAMQK